MKEIRLPAFAKTKDGRFVSIQEVSRELSAVMVEGARKGVSASKKILASASRISHIGRDAQT